VSLSGPASSGVKLTVAANSAPPISVDAQVPVVLKVAEPVVLELAAKFAAGAGLEEQPASFRTVETGFVVVEGLDGVPTAEPGTLTEFKVSCATVSAPLVMTLDPVAR